MLKKMSPSARRKSISLKNQSQRAAKILAGRSKTTNKPIQRFCTATRLRKKMRPKSRANIHHVGKTSNLGTLSGSVPRTSNLSCPKAHGVDKTESMSLITAKKGGHHTIRIRIVTTTTTMKIDRRIDRNMMSVETMSSIGKISNSITKKCIVGHLEMHELAVDKFKK